MKGDLDLRSRVSLLMNQHTGVCGAAGVTCEPHGACRSKRWRNRRGEGLGPQTHPGPGQEEAPPCLQLRPWARPMREQED